MSRLKVGMMIRTSYNTGPYIVTKIMENCTCPNFIDELSGKETSSKPHMHITCKRPDLKGGDFYLNGYDENLNSVWNSDRIIVCAEETLLLTMTAI